MGIPTPEKADQILMFTPVGINLNDQVYAKSISSAPLAFNVSVIDDRFFVDSIKIDGEVVEGKEFGSFADAVEECAKRMRTQSHVKYTVE